ncbi:MAG: hypothetical protein HC899_33890 [Leptolyngbyaceae cyanobacterium SM1_4_3]|nr:hypothetical protein [Leptolyngbyaceae cyanobacterium SM1_4_3]
MSDRSYYESTAIAPSSHRSIAYHNNGDRSRCDSTAIPLFLQIASDRPFFPKTMTLTLA